MVRQIDVNEIVKAVGGKILYWKDNVPVTSVVNFGDQPRNKCLYVITDFNNEVRLIKIMKDNQVSGVLVTSNDEIDIKKWKEAEIGVIEVTSMREAYLDLAMYYRQLFDIPMIEVIGSSGKTTTKEMIGSVLSQRYNTLIGYENFNAPSGVAYNILDLENNHEACVLEVGMKGFGIMDLSSGMVKPNIAVVTCIQPAHIVDLGSIENIIEAKSEILNHLNQEDVLIINGDDVNCLNMPLHKFKGKLYTFGLSESNDIYARNITYQDGVTTFEAVYRKNIYSYQIKTFGKYNVNNALSAILIGYLLDISANDIKNGLKSFKKTKGRQEVIKGIKDSIIINDNFNANPESTKLLIEELPNMVKDSSLVLVLGDLERPSHHIKDYAKEVHYDIGKRLGNLNLSALVLIGKWAKEYRNAAIEYGVSEEIIYYFRRVHDAKSIMKDLVKARSYVVFKAQKAYIDFDDLIDEISLK